MQIIGCFLHGKVLLLTQRQFREPVNGLDFESTEYLYRTMREYRAYGTLFFSSHILESLCRTADRILVLQNGHVTGTFRGDTLDPERIREALAE